MVQLIITYCQFVLAILDKICACLRIILTNKREDVVTKSFIYDIPNEQIEIEPKWFK